MDRNAIITTLRDHEAELHELGVVSLSLFGSIARGEDSEDSDIDLAVKLDPAKTPDGFRYFGRLSELQERMQRFLGRDVDIVPEPANKPHFQSEIDKDRILVF